MWKKDVLTVDPIWMRGRRGVRAWLGLAVSVALLLTGCGGGGDAQPAPAEPPAEEAPAELRGELAMVGGEFFFDLPASVPAGEYEFRLTNEGEYSHQAQIYRLEEGVSFEEFRDTLLSDATGAFGGLVGGGSAGVLGEVLSGQEGTGRGDLEPGVYAVVCSLKDIEGETFEPHYALGMVAELEVT